MWWLVFPEWITPTCELQVPYYKMESLTGLLEAFNKWMYVKAWCLLLSKSSSDICRAHSPRPGHPTRLWAQVQLAVWVGLQSTTSASADFAPSVFATPRPAFPLWTPQGPLVASQSCSCDSDRLTPASQGSPRASGPQSSQYAVRFMLLCEHFQSEQWGEVQMVGL